MVVWLGLLAVYVLAVLAGGADTAPPLPWAIERLAAEAGTFPVQLAGAALVAAGFAAAGGLARRVTGDPWATVATVLVALSPPALALATRVGPDPWATALLAGAVALTARCRTDPRRREALAAALLLAILPWFGLWHAAAGVLVLAALVRWTLRRGRPVVALVCVEVGLASAVSLAEVGVPVAPPAAPGAGGLPLLAVLLDRDAGVVRWAPVLLLALPGAWVLWRSARDGVARLVPERAEAEAAGLLAALVLVATVAAAAFAGLSPLPALPVAVPLVAWGLRRARRTAAVLGALTAALSAWAAVEVLRGTATGWTGPGLTGPWDRVFPDVTAGGPWPASLGIGLLAGLVATVVWEHRAREATLTAAARGR